MLLSIILNLFPLTSANICASFSPLLQETKILRPVVPYLKLDIHFPYEISQKQIIVYK